MPKIVFKYSGPGKRPYGNWSFDNLGFSIGKSENSGFSETVAASDLKQMDLMKICEY